MLRYGVICVWKFHFLLPVIEKFSENLKNFNYREGFFKILLHILVEVTNLQRRPPPPAGGRGGGSSQRYDKPPSPNVKCRPYHAPLRRYKAFKNEISITGNRKNFRKISITQRNFWNFFHILVELIELYMRPPNHPPSRGGRANVEL